jgi:hydroxypyruvate isomerase
MSALGAMGVGAAVGAEQPVGRPERKGKFQHSIARWVVEEHWSLAKTCEVARQLGCRSIELVPPEEWPVLKQNGLVCALASSHGFERGMNNPKYHGQCLEKLRTVIDNCAAAGFTT